VSATHQRLPPKAGPGCKVQRDLHLRLRGQACLRFTLACIQDRWILAGCYWVTNNSCTFLSLPRLIRGHVKA